MKKIFTSISMALCLMASSFNASAQQTAAQLSDAQKQEIQQKVLPVVFEQIKEQAGIDILGWAQPKLTADYLGSLPILGGLNNGLRADVAPYSVQPDSIILSSNLLNAPLLQAGKPGFFTSDLKIVFEDYQEPDLSLISALLGMDRGLSIKIPSKITATSGLVKLLTVNIDTEENSSLLNFSTDIQIGVMTSEPVSALNLSFGQNSETYGFDFNVKINDGMISLWDLMKNTLQLPLPTLPNRDYCISIDLMTGLSTMVFPISLTGINKEDDSTVNLGKADLAIATTEGAFPVQYINVTSYNDDETNAESAWNRFMFNMAQANQNIVLTIDQYKYENGNWEGSSSNEKRYTITMSDNTVNVSNVQSAVNAVTQNVISQLANEGEVAPYVMSIDETIDSDNDNQITNMDETNPIMDINVTPSEAGATINIQSYTDGKVSTVVDLIVETSKNEKGEGLISVDVVMGEAVIGSAYFTSNIWDVVTSNEDIQLANVEVTPVKDGIYVSGTTAASYRIVSMSGATVANGTVSGDNAYISTSALAKGIYVIVVTENGESKAIKFAR